MRYRITLLSLLIALSLYSQDNLLFTELYEIQGNKIKVYLDGVYKVIHKNCADYYMICEINNQLEFHDSVHIYDLKNRIVAKGIFQSSRLNGTYTSYFQNGKIESTGKYYGGARIGIWEFYYNNGQLKKVLDFGDGTSFPLLNTFYDKNGKLKIVEGNGKFIDLLSTSISGTNKTKYSGKVINGLQNGIWTIEVNGSVMAKEIFENGSLIEGTSFSLMLGTQKYYDRPVSTIFEINYLEYVKIWGPSVCHGGNEPGTLGISKTFYYNLHEIITKNKNDFKDSWFFLEIQTDNRGVFQSAIEFPKNDMLNSLINSGLRNKKVETIWSQSRAGNEVIIIYIKDDVYFSGTDKIDNFILNFRY